MFAYLIIMNYQTVKYICYLTTLEMYFFIIYVGGDMDLNGKIMFCLGWYKYIIAFIKPELL